MMNNRRQSLPELAMQRSFTLEYWRTEKWYVGRLKEVPGVCSQGKTLKELRENIRDAYRMMMMDQESAPEGAITQELVVDA